jgi:hypothetical protein
VLEHMEIGLTQFVPESLEIVPESLEHLNTFYKRIIEIELQRVKEIGYRLSEIYTVIDIYFENERRLAIIRLTYKVKTSVSSNSFTEESLRTTRDHHYIVAYPHVGEPRIIYSLNVRARRQRSSSSGWFVQVKTIHMEPSKCLENQEEV